MAISTANRSKNHQILKDSKKDLSPKWDGSESWTGEQLTRHFHDAMTWYRLEKTAKDLKPKVIDWMGLKGYDRDQIQAFKKTRDNRCVLTVGSIAANLLKGMPESHPEFNNGRNTADWLREQIQLIINQGKDDVEEVEAKEIKKVEVPQITIQDRIREQAVAMTEEIEAALDSFIIDPDSFDPKSFKISALLRQKGCKAAQSRMIKVFYQRGHEELMELASGSADEQLKEGYRHLPRKNVKKLIEFYESILQSCDQIAAEAKVLKKPRSKKAKPAEQLVAKLKFCLKEDKLGIVSVPPAQIIGAQGVVVYNTKTRKMGYYISKTSTGIEVKGTSLQNYTDKSVQKTLRKPPEQLKDFKEQNTQKRFQTWFDKSVKTTETALNGRISLDVIILKVFK